MASIKSYSVSEAIKEWPSTILGLILIAVGVYVAIETHELESTLIWVVLGIALVFNKVEVIFEIAKEKLGIRAKSKDGDHEA